MKKFHVHLAVEDIQTSVDFYSKLFGQVPAKHQTDYAKWSLDDPALNFAISTRGHATGVNHFGIQAASQEELQSLKLLADAASGANTLTQSEAACCYARSEKHWTIDPQGMAWEHFLTLEDVPVFGQDTVSQSGACCLPLHNGNDAAPSSCKSSQAAK